MTVNPILAASSPRLGLFVSSGSGTPKDMVAYACRAETAGFDSVWVNEGVLDFIVPLALMAEATSRIRLGSACAIVGRHPHVTQLALSGLDAASGGRIVPAFSDGPSGANRSWYGPRPARPIRRMHEFIELLRAMLAAVGGELEYTGEYFQIERYRRLSTPVRETIPLLVGATKPRMIRLAGEIADGWIAPALNCRTFFDEIAFPQLDAGLATSSLERTGFERASVRICSVADDEGIARARAARQIAYYVGIAPLLAEMLDLVGLGVARRRIEAAWNDGGLEAAAAAVPDQAIDLLATTGTPCQCRQSLNEFARGLDTVVLYPPVSGLSQEEISDAMSALIAAVAGAGQ